MLPQLHLVEKLPPVVSNHRCSVVQAAENCGVSAVAVHDGRRHPFRAANADPQGQGFSADHRVSTVAVLSWWSMLRLAGCADSAREFAPCAVFLIVFRPKMRCIMAVMEQKGLFTGSGMCMAGVRLWSVPHSLVRQRVHVRHQFMRIFGRIFRFSS